MAPLILASASPRRKDLLREHGYEFRVVPADVLEVAPSHLTAGEVTLHNARAKACAVASLHPNAVVLGVDTVVAFEGEIFGKPPDLHAAFAMAKRLNGRAHEVHSGVWLRHAATNRERGFVEITRVQFHRLTDAQLRAYLARMEGSFTNVVGLPMEALAEALKEFS
jgi:septum formation protein